MYPWTCKYNLHSKLRPQQANILLSRRAGPQVPEPLPRGAGGAPAMAEGPKASPRGVNLDNIVFFYNII